MFVGAHPFEEFLHLSEFGGGKLLGIEKGGLVGIIWVYCMELEGWNNCNDLDEPFLQALSHPLP